ncbi:I78 family peptidase inhibitor [uncultured Roseovarius sp.]|uniref:I78 family peptidase inhibitor n=1 Tax=uncultured Roseovarius sp. TaxID=293344 RepID=UPI0025FCF922|nr:I78 family peptidase inhibitor [uncultured Roseovarius sp.]
MLRLVFLGIGAFALAACQPEAETPPDMAESCGADALQHLLGEPRSAFDSMSVEAPTRILPPGSAMTMDHRPDRLNVDLDEDGRITRIWCG